MPSESVMNVRNLGAVVQLLLASALLPMSLDAQLDAQLVPTLEWEVGAAASGVEFGSGVTGQFLPDGRIVIRDILNRVVHLLDREGGKVREFGGMGEGPGEFQALGRMVVTDSTLTISDRRQRRYSVFALDGTHRRTEAVPFRGQPATSHWILPGGRVLLSSLDLLAPNEDPTNVRNRVAYSVEGSRLDTLLMQAVGGIGGYAEGRLVLVQNYLEPEGAYDLSGDSILVAGQGPNGVLKWWRLNPDGAEVVTSFDLGLGRAEIDRAACDRILEEYLDANPEVRRELPREFEVTCPRHWSGVLRIVGVSASEAWVELNRSPGVPTEERETEWVLVQATANAVTPVLLPDGAQILDGRGDEILVLRRTELDVPIIQLWRMNRP
jgi:hypothetical protein